MKISKIIIIYLLFSFVSFVSLSSVSVADNHEAEKNIIDKAKEINQQIKKKQAEAQLNITSETGSLEEPMPLNDPFVGDASLSSGSSSVTSQSLGADDDEISLYNFKLVGIITGEYESYVTLIDSSGEIATLEMFEDLSEGVKLVGLIPEEAIFQKKDETYLIINFKSQIRESLEAF